MPMLQRSIARELWELALPIIATNLGISINTAKSRYRYGLEKLRTLFNGELER